MALRVDGDEDIQVHLLPFVILGVDPAAQLQLVFDANRNRQVDAGEQILAQEVMDLAGMRTRLDLNLESLIVPASDSLHLLLAVRLSGAGRNYGFFQATFVSAETQATGLRSLARDQFGDIGPGLSQVFWTTNLQDEQLLSLSENPVRSEQVVFNFATMPRTAAIYTLSGRRVLDLMPRLNWDGSFIWNLHNTAGDRVASGVYLVLFDIGGRILREKLFVMGIER
jgi:hypothetical protein